MSARLVESLDEVLGSGAEALLETARRQDLMNDVAVGIVKEGEAFIRLIGKDVRANSWFELGSVTKIYTAELLAILVERGTVRLSDRVADYLPGCPVEDPVEDAIMLEDLATHRSGLPRLPPHVPLLSFDPYAHYDGARLEQYLAAHGLRRPGKREFLYSNLGYSVLGYALGNAAGKSYTELLQQEILDPLGMTETELAMGQPQPSLVQGHGRFGIPTPHWHFDVCAPCGGLCSTVGDQLKWMGWLLADPERLSFGARAEVTGGSIGLGWMISARSGVHWHNGATSGFSSWMSLDHRASNGVVILSNRQSSKLFDKLGGKFQRCLAGEPPGEL